MPSFFDYTPSWCTEILLPNIKNIEIEKEIYQPTTDKKNKSFFNDLVIFLQSHSSDFTLQLGSGCNVSPTYAHSIKKAYLESPILKADKKMGELLEVITPTDVFNRTDIPEKFAVHLANSMMISVVEKISYNFKGSEFVIAFNLAVMEFNIKQFKLKEKCRTAYKLHQHLLEMCKHAASEANNLIEKFSDILDSSYLLEDGNINYNGWVYEERTKEEIERIEKVKLIGNIILGNSWNELLETTYLKSMYLVNITYPTSSDDNDN